MKSSEESFLYSYFKFLLLLHYAWLDQPTTRIVPLNLSRQKSTIPFEQVQVLSVCMFRMPAYGLGGANPFGLHSPPGFPYDRSKIPTVSVIIKFPFTSS